MAGQKNPRGNPRTTFNRMRRRDDKAVEASKKTKPGTPEGRQAVRAMNSAGKKRAQAARKLGASNIPGTVAFKKKSVENRRRGGK